MTNATYKQVALYVLAVSFLTYHSEQRSFTTLYVKVKFHC